ncbi:MAG: hypothetical protein M3R00_09325, partial [Pseudomonadota bacterium]|nr:hypothetical protein [Pseudomonadota bacterium]
DNLSLELVDRLDVHTHYKLPLLLIGRPGSAPYNKKSQGLQTPRITPPMLCAKCSFLWGVFC